MQHIYIACCCYCYVKCNINICATHRPRVRVMHTHHTHTHISLASASVCVFNIYYIDCFATHRAHKHNIATYDRWLNFLGAPPPRIRILWGAFASCICRYMMRWENLCDIYAISMLYRETRTRTNGMLMRRDLCARRVASCHIWYMRNTTKKHKYLCIYRLLVIDIRQGCKYV